MSARDLARHPAILRRLATSCLLDPPAGRRGCRTNRQLLNVAAWGAPCAGYFGALPDRKELRPRRGRARSLRTWILSRRVPVHEGGSRAFLGALPYSDGVRELACEMLDVQHDARRAFGYEGAGRAMQASLRRLLARLHGGNGEQRETRGPHPFSSLAVGHVVGWLPCAGSP